ncbi:MAG: penicillin-binding transpeptidase domain-containing protein [Chitinophagaceae bacterium]
MKNSLLLCGLFAGMSSCALNNVKTRHDWGSYFQAHQVKGCFMLYDNAHGSFQIYHLKGTQLRFVPAGTFQIMDALVGLETGKIADTGIVSKWEGTSKPDTLWKQDLSLGKAFRTNATPYFQSLARSIGPVVLKFWIDSVKYGNMQIGGPIDSFWLNNSMRISADEQLGLLKELYFDQLPFQERSDRLVKDILLKEKTPQYSLFFQTGVVK